MRPLRIFRHVACEGPGYLGTLLEQQAIPYEVACIDAGVRVPTRLDDVCGLVFMGGAMSVNDTLPWIDEELKLIQQAFAQDIPVLGICLGGQLISKALGGSVSKGHAMEIGWHPVTATVEHSHWLQDLPKQFVPFHWHADTFSIPSGANPLLHSSCYAQQAFAIGRSLALQFHIEMTPAMVEEWVALYHSDLEQGSPCAQSADEILADLPERIASLQGLSKTLFTNWLSRVYKYRQ